MPSVEAIVLEILQLSNAGDVLHQVAGAIMRKSSATLRQALHDVPESELLALEDELEALVHENLKQQNDLAGVLGPIYQKYYTQEELIALRDFYLSPLGRKMIKCTSALLADSMDVINNWAQEELLPKIKALLEKRIAHITSIYGESSS